MHDALVARAAMSPASRTASSGLSLDGRAIDCLTVGDGAKQVWLYARQHPGESMAEWWMEGALERLTDTEDAVTKALLDKATIHVVPNMNPDGSFAGICAPTRPGVNLNREWARAVGGKEPRSAVRARCDGRDRRRFAMDIHGDEAIPANFLAGFEGIPSLDRRRTANASTISGGGWPRARPISRPRRAIPNRSPARPT